MKSLELCVSLSLPIHVWWASPLLRLKVPSVLCLLLRLRCPCGVVGLGWLQVLFRKPVCLVALSKSFFHEMIVLQSFISFVSPLFPTAILGSPTCTLCSITVWVRCMVCFKWLMSCLFVVTVHYIESYPSRPCMMVFLFFVFFSLTMHDGFFFVWISTIIPP